MIAARWTLAVLLVLAGSAAPAGTLPKMVVLELKALDRGSEHAAQALVAFVAQDIAKTRRFDVVSQQDLQTLIGVERQRQLIGCSDEGATSSCLTELAGAVNAKYLVYGTVSSVGKKLRVDLQILETRSSKVAARGSESTEGEAGLSDVSRSLVVKLAHQLPEGAGASLNEGLGRGWWVAGAVGAGVLGLGAGGAQYLALQQAELFRSADPSLQGTAALNATVERGKLFQNTAMVLAAGAGASALFGLGVAIFGVPERELPRAPKVTLLVSPSSIVLAGSFP